MYNSDTIFELEGRAKLDRDPVCGAVLRGYGAFFCVGEERDEIVHSARRVMEAFSLEEGREGGLAIGIDEFVELARFLHLLQDFEQRRGTNAGFYVTSYEKVNRLFAKNMFWHFLFSKGMLLKDTRFMERPYRTAFERVWQRVEPSSDRLSYFVDSLVFLPSRNVNTVRHRLPYIYSSEELVGALGLLRGQLEGCLETYEERMTLRAAAFSDRVEEMLKSDYVDVVYIQTRDLYQDESVLRDMRKSLDAGRDSRP